LGSTWNDFRLVFFDLWLTYEMNLLSKAEMEKIWHPVIKFDHAELTNFDYNIDAQIYVKRYESNDNIFYTHAKELLAAKVFQGSHNSLFWTASIRYSNMFLYYNKIYWPFQLEHLIIRLTKAADADVLMK
jgi:hypothetical protein